MPTERHWHKVQGQISHLKSVRNVKQQKLDQTLKHGDACLLSQSLTTNNELHVPEKQIPVKPVGTVLEVVALGGTLTQICSVSSLMQSHEPGNTQTQNLLETATSTHPNLVMYLLSVSIVKFTRFSPPKSYRNSCRLRLNHDAILELP